MIFMAVDDEKLALKSLKQALLKAKPGVQVEDFQRPEEALSFAQNNKVDVAFLDIDMGTMSGLVLAKHLKDIHGQMNIIFVTGYSRYAIDAFTVAASGYILKPINVDAVIFELNNLRYPLMEAKSERIQVKCFGSFGIFIDGDPLMLSRSKSKELLAYLVHKRGAAVNSAEIAAVLWEDKEYNRSLRSQTQTVISQLMKVLRDIKAEDIICKSWNSIAVNTKKFSCDYYDFLEGNVQAINSYTGEYMNEYSWAEFTVEYLNQKIR